MQESKRVSLRNYVKGLRHYNELGAERPVDLLKAEVLLYVSNPLFQELDFNIRVDILENVVQCFANFFGLTNEQLCKLYFDFLDLDKLSTH